MNKASKNQLQCKCQQVGIEVGFDTVFNLSNNYIRNTIEDVKYYLCLNKECDIAYYAENEKYITTNQITKSIWFKNDRDQFVVCYCRDISLEDIVFAINQITEPINITKVVHFLQKDGAEISCIQNNPTGMTCEKLFINAIEYAKKIKNITNEEM